MESAHSLNSAEQIDSAWLSETDPSATVAIAPEEIKESE